MTDYEEDMLDRYIERQYAEYLEDMGLASLPDDEDYPVTVESLYDRY